MEVTPIHSSSPRTEFEDMLRSCTFVSLHCPLTAKTRGLIGKAELAMMPRGSMIINYARGEVIDKEVRTLPDLHLACVFSLPHIHTNHVRSVFSARGEIQ